MSSCAPLGVPYGPGYYDNGYNGGVSYISSLPYGYSTVYVSGTPFFFHNNFWYRRSSRGFYKTSRPLGYKGNLGRINNNRFLTRLPGGFKSHNIGGVRYFNNGNSWYTLRGGKYYPTSRPKNFRSSVSRSNIRSGNVVRQNIRSGNTVRSGSRFTNNRRTTTNRNVAPGFITSRPSATNTTRSRSTTANRVATQRSAAAQRAAAQRATTRTSSTGANTTSSSTQQEATETRGRFRRSR